MPVWKNVPNGTKIGDILKDGKTVIDLRKHPSITRLVNRYNIIEWNKDKEKFLHLSVPEIGPDLLWAQII